MKKIDRVPRAWKGCGRGDFIFFSPFVCTRLDVKEKEKERERANGARCEHSMEYK